MGRRGQTASQVAGSGPGLWLFAVAACAVLACSDETVATGAGGDADGLPGASDGQAVQVDADVTSDDTRLDTSGGQVGEVDADVPVAHDTVVDATADGHPDADVGEADADIDPDAETGDLPAPPVSVSGLFFYENPANPLSFFVEWSTEPPIPTELSVDCGPDYQQSFVDEVPRSDHEVFVVGLLAGTTCNLQVHPTRVTDGTTTALLGSVTLPEGLPVLDV